ncbi:hypothetical protein ABID99_003619 [Mucilaginibacter sp. OAE612]|uniref:glycosyl hydrolase n=1 Tax=Mucilaginibacter sp. OAE612 TaxID=3156444 RepID=UPI00359D90AF
MLKFDRTKLWALGVTAGCCLASCSIKDDVQPAHMATIPENQSTVFASTATTTVSSKITVAGSTLQLGINGHPLGDQPYIQTPATKQISLLKGMGMNWYRIDCMAQSDGTITVPHLLSPLLDAAAAGKVNILPMLYTRTMDLTKSQSYNYEAGKKLGTNFGAKYAQNFEYYDLGNDLTLDLLLPGKVGWSQYDFDRTKFNRTAAYLKGMDEGLKSQDPNAKTMISAGWLQYAFLRMCDTYGVKFNVVAYHWYSEMERLAPNYKINDITVKLGSLFPKKPIWITESNIRYSSTQTQSEKEQNQNTFVANFVAKCKANPQVKVLMFYELFDEPLKSAQEGSYGFLKWTTPYTSWAKKQVATNLTIY